MIAPLESRTLLSAWTPSVGDANADGLIGYADYQALEAGYGKSGTWSTGDFNADGRVTFADYQLLEAAVGHDIVPLPVGETYHAFSGVPLWTDGPDYHDARQGAVGDCYFLAALSSLAQSDPAFMQGMVTARGDGTYVVRFFTGNGNPRYVRVDAQLPVTTGETLKYAKLTPDGELWVALAEKAFAYFRTNENTYVSINSGWLNQAYYQVTGVPAVSTYVPQVSRSQLANLLQSNILTGHAVIAGTKNTPAAPLVGNHAYTVVSAYQDGSEWFVQVYNAGGGSPLTITLDQFYDNFTEVSVAQI